MTKRSPKTARKTTRQAVPSGSIVPHTAIDPEVEVANQDAAARKAEKAASRRPSASNRPRRRSVAKPAFFIGPRLKALREKSGLPLKELANELSLSVAQICRYENDNVAVPLARLIVLAEFFQVPTSYLQGTADGARHRERTIPDDVKAIHSRAKNTSDRILQIRNLVRQKRVIAIVQSVVNLHSKPDH